METFETYENKQAINAKVTISSLAAKDRGPSFFFLDDNALGNGDSATISKSDVKNPSVLNIRVNLALDQVQNTSPDRLRFIKSTKIEFKISDRDTKKTFYSNFDDFPTEFHFDDDNTFFIRKEIQIKFLEDFRSSHKSFVQSL
ncbi:hypothetical protein [uncultured Psychroserpens sp.]|uniref:hypothetical protein n=1 Tax=uncultured Psychroserpens sp. TaxID=255436 RepID=UPI00261D2485|nr:hypothetical protein [uncultured Psychroserpens sp.]